jgi:hypothetical protein
MSKDKIPATDSIEELADFWDTHDLSDYEDELAEVGEPVFEREKLVKVPLPLQEAEAVESLAKSKGLDSGNLIREWILERLQRSA